MRSKLSAAAALALACAMFTTAARAQDFSGTYIGAHAGYRWVDADLSTPPYMVFGSINVPARSENYNADGAIAGVHLGHLLRLSPSIYFGVEGDLSAGWGSNSKAFGVIDFSQEGFAQIRSTVDANWQGTLRLRLGYAAGQALFYATGGLAFMDVDWRDTVKPDFGPPSTASKSELMTGWVLGGGVEYAMNTNLSLRVEYLYEDLGQMSVPLAGSADRGVLDVTAQKLRVGITYRFDGTSVFN